LGTGGKIKSLFSETLSRNYVDYWNNLPYVRRHRASTKVYKKALFQLESLKKGRFKKSWISEEFVLWTKRNNTDHTLLFCQWSDKEIKRALNNLSLLFDPDYLPVNKDKMPKNLHQLVYDPFTGMSLFLLYHDKQPMQNKEYITKKKLAELSRVQLKLINYAQRSINITRGYKSDEKIKLINLLEAIKDYYKENQDQIDNNQFSGYGDLWMTYFDWVQEEYRGFTKLSPVFLFPKKKIFQRFLSEAIGQGVLI
jgi:hypothetical protein